MLAQMTTDALSSPGFWMTPQPWLIVGMVVLGAAMLISIFRRRRESLLMDPLDQWPRDPSSRNPRAGAV